MNKKIVIQIPFNVQGFNKKNELDERWMKYRLQLFIKYNMKSLQNQTSQYFTALFRCRDITIPYIKKEIGNKLPENIKIVGINEYQKKVKELIKNYNYLYLVRMDSDDLYEKNFIDMLQNYSPGQETEVLINQNCYIYDICQKRLAYFWYNSPQSFILIYRTSDYNQGKRYYLKNGHGGAILLKYELIPGINYMDTIHKRNDSSYFEGGRGGKKKWSEIKDRNDIEEILNDFGISLGRKTINEKK